MSFARPSVLPSVSTHFSLCSLHVQLQCYKTNRIVRSFMCATKKLYMRRIRNRDFLADAKQQNAMHVLYHLVVREQIELHCTVGD